MQVQTIPYQSPDVVGFLQHLHYHIRGKVLGLWDGTPIHRRNMVKVDLSWEH